MKDIAFLDIILERSKNGITPVLNELSLSRAYQLAKGGSFGIVTAYRANLPPADNKKRMSALKSLLRAKNYGYSQMFGHWQNCTAPDVQWQDCPPEALEDTLEPSLFVYQLSREDAVDIMRAFDQDGVLYSGPETNGRTTLLLSSGDEIPLGEFQPNTIAQAYTTLKGGRSFTFEYVANSFSEMILETNWKQRKP